VSTDNSIILSGLTFGDAFTHIKAGKKVCRAGWDGKEVWLRDTPADATTDNRFVPWRARQTDMLAEDWMVVE